MGNSCVMLAMSQIFVTYLVYCLDCPLFSKSKHQYWCVQSQKLPHKLSACSARTRWRFYIRSHAYSFDLGSTDSIMTNCCSKCDSLSTGAYWVRCILNICSMDGASSLEWRQAMIFVQKQHCTDLKVGVGA
jgi:hypothetical protein